MSRDEDAGKLGRFVPFHGTWDAEAVGPMGPARCQRRLEPVLGGHYLQLTAKWQFGPEGSAQSYEEICLIGVGDEGQVRFWSFTPDGNRSEGLMADVTELHPDAVDSRPICRPDEPAWRTGRRKAGSAGWRRRRPKGGFRWVAEAKTETGWSRFVEHSNRKAIHA